MNFIYAPINMMEIDTEVYGKMENWKSHNFGFFITANWTSHPSLIRRGTIFDQYEMILLKSPEGRWTRWNQNWTKSRNIVMCLSNSSLHACMPLPEFKRLALMEKGNSRTKMGQLKTSKWQPEHQVVQRQSTSDEALLVTLFGPWSTVVLQGLYRS